MSAIDVTAREAIQLLVDRADQVGLKGQISEAMDAGKVVKEELSKRRKKKRVEKPSRRVALTDVEALQEAVRVFRAAFLELPAVFASIDTEVQRHKTESSTDKLGAPTVAQIELRGEDRVTTDGPELIRVTPVSDQQLAEMKGLVSRLQSLLSEVRQ